MKLGQAGAGLVEAGGGVVHAGPRVGGGEPVGDAAEGVLAGLEAVQKGIFRLVGNSFMKLAIFFLEVGSDVRGVKAQIAVSSTEQLAPICREPYGRVC